MHAVGLSDCPNEEINEYATSNWGGDSMPWRISESQGFLDTYKMIGIGIWDSIIGQEDLIYNQQKNYRSYP